MNRAARKYRSAGVLAMAVFGVLAGGCAAEGSTLATFAGDFVRSLFAAWLL